MAYCISVMYFAEVVKGFLKIYYCKIFFFNRILCISMLRT